MFSPSSGPVDYRSATKNELSELFCEQVNPSRISGGFPPYTIARMNFKLQHLDLHDRKLLYGSCLGARNFAALFEHSLRVRKPLDTA